MNLEKVGLFALIAILGGLATSPVFSSSYSAFAEGDEVSISDEATVTVSSGEDEMKEAEQDEMEEEASDEMERPTVCTMEYAPVCGTDGETYGNMCMLEASDAELAHEGECETDYKDDDYFHDKDRFEEYCEMSDEEKREFLATHRDNIEELKEKLDRFCAMSDEEREEYHKEYKDKHMDKEYDLDDKLERYCELSDEEKAEVESKYDRLTDEMKDRIAEYCSLSEDERDAYLETHHDMMMDFKERHHEMVDDMKDGHQEIRMQKMMERDYKITDERTDELKMKFREKHSDLSDKQRDEIRLEIEAKYDKHYKMKFKARHDALSDQERDDLLKRHSEMRDYKVELREKHDAMTDEQRDQFRMDFYTKAQDVRHAWLSPRIQMMAGISADQIECREGLNLVMMNSNGKPMCMKSSSAEKLIERGIVVPTS